MDLLRNVSNFSEPLISSDELTQLLAISDELEADRPAPKEFNTHLFYMHFLELSLENASKSNTPTLSLNEQRLLEKIAVLCETDNPMSVTDACQLRQLGCSSTIHHLIHKLSHAGLIYLQAESNHSRRKFLYLSQMGQRYFQDVENCIDMAMSGQ